MTLYVHGNNQEGVAQKYGKIHTNVVSVCRMLLFCSIHSVFETKIYLDWIYRENPDCLKYTIVKYHICKETGLRIVNGRLHNDECIGNYTCYNNRGSSVVDYLLTNYDNFDNVIDFMVGDANEYSKHAPITFSVKTNHTTHTARTSKTKNTIRWRSDRQDEYIGVIQDKVLDLERVIKETKSPECNINDVVNDFTKILYSCSFDVFGKVTAYCNNKYPNSPWFDNECKDYKAAFRNISAVYKKSPTDDNRRDMLHAKQNYNRAIKKAKGRYAVSERKKVTNMAQHSPNAFWKYVKQQSRKQDTHDVTLNEFYNHFSNLATFDCNENTHQSACNQISVDDLDKTISHEEVKKAIDNLGRGKSSGLDDLVNEMFLDGRDILTPFLAKLFNYIFENNKYPTEWTKGYIVPIPKKGNMKNANNYRGITIISVLAKLFSSVLNNRLNQWCENNNL